MPQLGRGPALGVIAAERLLGLRSVNTAPGLTETELEQTQQRYGIEFADDHAAFLATCLPVGPRWPDWRAEDPQPIARRLRGPVDGVLFDVAENKFWYDSWGRRPAGAAEALSVAGRCLSVVPRLIPVYGHRYLPAGRGTSGRAVLSVVQTDIVVYGADLADYVEREFGEATDLPPPARGDVAFWSALVR